MTEAHLLKRVKFYPPGRTSLIVAHVLDELRTGKGLLVSAYKDPSTGDLEIKK